MKHEETGLSSSCYHKSETPTGGRSPEPMAVPMIRSFLPLFPGLCGRQELSTMHCSQRGHLTPDTPSASREVTGTPSKHLQINLPPETRGPSTLDGEPPSPPQSTQPHLQGAKAARGLCEHCSPACQSTAETSCLCQDSLAGSRPREHWRWLWWIRWGWDICTEQPPWCATALVLQCHCALSPGCLVVSSSRTIQHGCCPFYMHSLH